MAAKRPSSSTFLLSPAPAAKRVKGKVSAAAMNALDTFHRQTQMTMSQGSYTPPQTFNDAYMVQHSSSSDTTHTNGLKERRLSTLLSFAPVADGIDDKAAALLSAGSRTLSSSLQPVARHSEAVVEEANRQKECFTELAGECEMSRCC